MHKAMSLTQENDNNNNNKQQQQSFIYGKDVTSDPVRYEFLIMLKNYVYWCYENQMVERVRHSICRERNLGRISGSID